MFRNVSRATRNLADFPLAHTPAATPGSDPLPSLSKRQPRRTGDFLLAAANDQSGESEERRQVRMVSTNQRKLGVIITSLDLFQLAKTNLKEYIVPFPYNRHKG